MAKLPGAFNSENHEDMGSFDPIPIGNYTAVIEESDVVDTKAGDGKRLNLVFKIIGGDFDGRKIWNGLNIENPSAKAVEISQKELATICRACNKVSISDSDQLHGIPMVIKVGIEAATAQYPAKNKINGYKAYEGPTPTQTAKKSADPVKPKTGDGSNTAKGKKPWD